MTFADGDIQKRARELGITEDIPAFFEDLLSAQPVPEDQFFRYEPVYTRGILDIDPKNSILYPNKDSYACFMEIV